MEVGLPQGSAMSSLFVVVMDKLESLRTIIFTDDILIYSETREVEVYSGNERNEGQLTENLRRTQVER